MLRKSRIIALLSVCVMMFGVVEPVFAWRNRTGSQAGDAALYGTGAGAVVAGAVTVEQVMTTAGLGLLSLKDHATEALNSAKQSYPVAYSSKSSAVPAAKKSGELLKTFDSSKNENVRKFENSLQNLANEGRKVKVLELKKTSQKLTVTYTVDCIVHVRTFDL